MKIGEVLTILSQYPREWEVVFGDPPTPVIIQIKAAAEYQSPELGNVIVLLSRLPEEVIENMKSQGIDLEGDDLRIFNTKNDKWKN